MKRPDIEAIKKYLAEKLRGIERRAYEIIELLNNTRTPLLDLNILYKLSIIREMETLTQEIIYKARRLYHDLDLPEVEEE